MDKSRLLKIVMILCNGILLLVLILVLSIVIIEGRRSKSTYKEAEGNLWAVTYIDNVYVGGDYVSSKVYDYSDDRKSYIVTVDCNEERYTENGVLCNFQYADEETNKFHLAVITQRDIEGFKLAGASGLGKSDVTYKICYDVRVYDHNIISPLFYPICDDFMKGFLEYE